MVAAVAGDFPTLNQNTTGSAASLTTGRSITATGDADWTVTFDGSTNVSAGLTLASVNSNVGSWGSASSVPTFTVNAKGLVTAASNTSIQIAETQITDGTILARVGSNETITGNWTFNNPVVGADPTVASNFATKQYVDNAVAGLTWKTPVLVATTANITLSGLQTIDGVSVTAGNRVLVKNQNTTSQNGIYVAASGSWTRATDFDSVTPIDEINGAAVFVTTGSTQSDTGWTETATVVTVGTDPITFVQFSAAGAYTAGAGLSLTGNTFNVGTASSSRIVVNVDDIDLATVTDSGTGTFLKLTRDSYGRVSGTTAVVASDITGLVNSTYVLKAGDTMTGALQVNSTLGATGTATLNGVTNIGGGIAPGNYVLRALSTTGDRLRIASLGAGSGVSMDVTDSGETTTARPLTLGASNSNVYLGSSTQFTKAASGMVGIGVTPNANWRAGAYALQTGPFVSLWTQANGSSNLGFGVYEGGTNTFNYLTTGDAPTLYSQISGRHRWFNGPSGTANGSATLTQYMELDSAGQLLVGAGAPSLGSVPFIVRVGTNQNAAIVSQSSAATLIGYSDTGVSAKLRVVGSTLELSGNGSTTHVTLDSSGQLGIGKTPAQKLDVQLARGTWNTYETSTGIAWVGAAANGYASGIQFTDVANSHRWQIVKAPAADQLVVQGGGDYWAGGGAPYGRYDTSGFTGMSTTSGQGLQVVFRGGPTGTNGGALNFANWNNSSSEVQMARIYCQTTSGSVGNEAGDMIFYTKAAGGSLAQALRLTDGKQILDSNNLELGWKRIPASSTTSGNLAASDVGKHIPATSGVTVPQSVFSIGDAVTIYNNTSGNITITQASGVTLRFAGTASTGNRTLAQRGLCTVLCIASNEFVISGAGLT